VLILAAALVLIGAFAGGLAWLLDPPKPPTGATRGTRLYYALCADCHGRDGRGSWRAALFLIRPGDLTDRETAAAPDRYLADLIRHGGAPIGRPGMPAFGAQLSDADIEALVRFVRSLPRDPADPPPRGGTARPM
jgi:mono/diheme cytochrome c family protein